MTTVESWEINLLIIVVSFLVFAVPFVVSIERERWE